MILETLAAASRRRAEALHQSGAAAALRARTEGFYTDKGEEFLRRLKRPGLSFICELKKASPSKGVIARHFPYMEIAGEYETGGADALSCLTEPDYFLGSIDYLKTVSERVSLPVLRKDFITDTCQVDEAALAGAAAVLLIAAMLTDRELAALQARARALGLAALVEVHDENEAARALQAGAGCIGINHRNLKDFSMDLSLTERLRPLIPAEIPCVAESGMMDQAVVRRMKESGADAVLIGEMLMRTKNRVSVLKTMVEENQKERRAS